jgi:hypothetical protein
MDVSGKLHAPTVLPLGRAPYYVYVCMYISVPLFRNLFFFTHGTS